MNNKLAFRAFSFKRIGSLRASVSPVSILFGANEPGIIYDISDVANLDWRRNLLTWSEDFSNAAWGKNNATVTANAAVAPDGTTTADLLVIDITGRVLWFDNTGISGTKTQSLYVKADTATDFSITAVGGQFVNGGNMVTVNLTTGQVTSGHLPSVVSVLPVGNNWFRIAVTVSVSVASGNSTYWQIGPTSGILVWGAQLELGSTATEYQRITDLHTEVRERFPLATLFQDRAGSQPVTTPGQSVGLMLDKSRGLVLGPELVTNGTFDTNVSGWTAGGTGVTIAAIGGQLVISTPFANGGADTTVSTISGRTYKVTFDWVGTTSKGNTIFAAGSTNSPALNSGNPGTYIFVFVATGATTTISARIAGGSEFTATYDNISVRELPGFHAVANSDAARGVYGIEPFGGRRNLLTFTEQFDNVVWAKTAATVTANTAVAPNGTATADLLLPNATNDLHAASSLEIARTFQPVVLSFYVKNAGARYFGLRFGRSAARYAFFDFQNIQSFTLAGNSTQYFSSVAVTDVGDGWFRVTASNVSDDFGGNYTVRLYTLGSQPVGGGGFVESTLAYTGDGTSGVIIWGAQLEVGSTATAYQKVTTDFDVTEAGVPTVHYIEFDGADDSYTTSTITPGTDKLQVFAGVRKLSDTQIGVLYEFSSNLNNNTGTFWAIPGYAGSGSTSGPFWNVASKGAAAVNATSPAAFPAPQTVVQSHISDISGPRLTLRINGSQVAESISNQGPGNFLDYPLFIGTRGGTSLPFRGRIYAMVARFGPNLPAETITQMERWVAQKTGVTL